MAVLTRLCQLSPAQPPSPCAVSSRISVSSRTYSFSSGDGRRPLRNGTVEQPVVYGYLETRPGREDYPRGPGS